MGIDTQASIFVGLPRSEIESPNLGDWIEEEALTVCPPCYDGNGVDWAICGFEVATSDCYNACEFTWDQAQVDTLKERFKARTGQDAKVWLSPNVW